MTETSPLFRFEFHAVTRSDDSYYHTNWDNKVPITVVAKNKGEAMRAAEVALGAPRRGRHWAFRAVSVTDHRIPEATR